MHNILAKSALLVVLLVGAAKTASADVTYKTMSIDFENLVKDYLDWSFSYFGFNNEATAHGGKYYGKNNSDNASLKTNEKVNPISLTCYISKPSSNNNNKSTWSVQVSTDGSQWTTVSSVSSISMNSGAWQEFTADLSSYSNVYVRIYLSGSTQVRYIDDLTLTLKDFTADISSACTDGTKYYGTLSVPYAFTVPGGVTVSEIGVSGSKLVVRDYAANAVVPANTGVMISSSTAGGKDFTAATDGSSVLGSDNMLKPSGNAGITDASQMTGGGEYFRLTMHNGSQIGFWWGAENGAPFTMGANKAYLAVPSSELSALSRAGLWLDSEMQGIDYVSSESQADNIYYNLQGQLVDSPKKGLYIVNGKIVMVK